VTIGLWPESGKDTSKYQHKRLNGGLIFNFQHKEDDLHGASGTIRPALSALITAVMSQLFVS
jgi:hypothetical protein